jgi:hypothetical protein
MREERREEEWVEMAILMYITSVGVDNAGQIFRSSNGSHRVSQIIIASLEYSIFIMT